MMIFSAQGLAVKGVAEYLFRPKAKTDVEDIWSYTLETWGIDQADQYVKNLIDTCSSLAKNPDMGVARDELRNGLHVHPSGKHLIFYLKIKNDIDIVRILHERMDCNLHLLLG